MKCNWQPENPVFLDFETQSSEPLTTVHKYASSSLTRALTCVVKVDGTVHRFGPYLDAEAKQKLAAITEGRTIVAHNAPFDEAIWTLSEGLPEREWYDTLPVARAAGLPGKLDDIGTILTGEGKDKNGKRLIDMLCILKPGSRIPAVGPAHGLLMEYNVRDVELLESIFHQVRAYGEPEVMSVDRTINERGIPLGREFLGQLLDLYDKNETKLRAEFESHTGGVNPGSAKQVKDWMQQMGFKVPQLNGKDSIGKFALKDFMSRPDEFYVGDGEEDAAVEAVVEAMELRKEVVRVGRGKADRALAALEADDRIRDQFVYWGAHTGRWAGRDLQLHNMPHTVKEVDVLNMDMTYDSVVAATRAASEKAGYRIGCADVLNAMLRHLVRAPSMLVADYSAVEARGTAWIADETRMLDLYADPHKSVYLDMGKQVFGRAISKSDKQEYTISKTLVLGCTYGMSGAKFEYTCKSRGVSTAAFATMGMKPADAVKVYRTTYPRIPALWKELHQAIHWAVKGVPMEAGKCKFYMVGRHMHAELPSGRSIVYRNARVEPRIPGYCKLYGMPETPVDTFVFDLPRIKTGFLYGSKVCENLVQGICRDLLAYALVCFEQEGLQPFLHVHDEAACLADRSKFHRFLEIMSTPPSWAKGFPLMVEGYVGNVWTKQAESFEHADAICGRILA